MTDKEYREQKQRVRKYIKKWVKPLGLNWYKVDFEYDRTGEQPERTEYSPKTINGYWKTPMSVTADPYYLRANVTCYLDVVSEMEEIELEETFLHELMHIFLRPMQSKATAKEEEFVATKLAQAFIWSQKK